MSSRIVIVCAVAVGTNATNDILTIKSTAKIGDRPIIWSHCDKRSSRPGIRVDGEVDRGDRVRVATYDEPR